VCSSDLLPNTFMLNTALSELRRQDCDRENQCLTLFAVKADTLYALYVGVDYDVAKNVSVVGRVVRNDGIAVVEQKSLTQNMGKESFGAVAKALLTKLVRDELKLGALPATRAVAAKPPENVPPPVADAGVAVVVAPPPVVDAGVVVLPPPPPPPLEEGPMKTIGYVTTAVGAAGVVAGAIVFGAGSGSARAVNSSGSVVPAAGESAQDAVKAYRQAQTLQPVGLVSIGVGAAIAAAGVVMIALSPATAGPKVSVVPLVGGGGLVGIEGELP
jgi:hypothetical protein